MKKSVLADTQGATAVLTALVLATVTGFVALGIEAASGLQAKRAVQDAADASALAGTLAFRAAATGDPANATKAVLADYGFSKEAGDRISIKAPVQNNSAGRVEVIISRPRASRFASLLNDDGGTIEARAVAHLVETATGCILGLAPDKAIAIRRQSDLRLQNCSILSAEMGVPPIRLAEADPYRDVSLPAVRPCTGKTPSISSPTQARSGRNPLVFCSGLHIESSGQLQLAPGVYAIAGGPLIVRKGGTLAGRGVSILLLAGASAQFAEGATIALEAPVGGPFAGLALAAGPYQGSSNLLSGASQRIVGAIHMPAHDLHFAGSASSPCTHIIANRVTIAGVTKLENACAKAGTRPLVDRVARLAE